MTTPTQIIAGNGTIGGVLLCQSGTGSAGTGGNLNIFAGGGTSAGGSINVTCGNASAGTAGNISITAGNGTTSGGNINLTPGNNSGGTDGAININQTADGPSELRFLDASGSPYVGFKAPAVATTNTVWSLPPADGTNGQFLQTNGAAALSWVPVPAPWTFLGYISIDLPFPAGVITKITVQTELLDRLSEYNTGTGLYTPTVSGTYIYAMNLTIDNAATAATTWGTAGGTSRGVAGFVDNATNLWVSRFNYNASQDDRAFYCTGVVSLTAGLSYYFGIAGPTTVAGTLIANPTGITGSGIGTFFGIYRII